MALTNREKILARLKDHPEGLSLDRLSEATGIPRNSLSSDLVNRVAWGIEKTGRGQEALYFLSGGKTGRGEQANKRQTDKGSSPIKDIGDGPSKFLKIKHLVEFAAALIAVIGGILAFVRWIL